MNNAIAQTDLIAILLKSFDGLSAFSKMKYCLLTQDNKIKIFYNLQTAKKFISIFVWKTVKKIYQKGSEQENHVR